MRVAVIGAGPVGQTTALLLARWGVPVVLLDERPCRDAAGSKAICQQGDVLDIWDSVGAGRAIAGEGVTWACARTFYRDRELFSYTLGKSDASFPPFVNISQARTEQILDQRIAAEPLIDVRWNHKVTGIDQDETGVTVHAGSVGVRASYAVACAGAGGEAVRQMLGVSFAGQAFADKFLICDIRTDLPGWTAERRFYFDPPWNPGRQVLIHPCPDSTFRIDWQVPGDYDPASDVLDARIRAVIGDRPYQVVWRSVYRFQSKVADRMRVGRVLLAGDCAHLFSPFGARGLNSGVADAENAAWKIAFVLRGWAGTDLLESYHAERHAAAVENLAVTRATMDFLVPHDAEQLERRRTVLAGAAGDAALRSQVDSGRLAEPFWYTASPLTTPDPARPFAGRPPRGTVPAPAPGILIPDVPLPGGRLRALARTGLVALGAIGTGGTRGGEARGGGARGGGARGGGARGVGARGGAARADGAGAGWECVTAVPMDDALCRALGARPGEQWLIRPDAYVAAIARDPSALSAALRRCLCLPG
ncbi:MAG TPA: FAD-dependent monooxygenase [Streptosporangiaceae bacterium]|nr:FAD-dependent monooxygenase [Streptosporangiaceae bacterium]